MIITIPMVVMVVSALIWLVCVKSPQLSDPWVIDVCRILFAASALVVLLGITGKPLFS